MSKSTLSENASWLVNAGIDDTQRRLAAMTGTPEDIADLHAALAHETAGQQRVSRLKPMQSKLRSFQKVGPQITGLEILADQTDNKRRSQTDATAEVTEDQPKDPAWDGIRETAKQLHAVGRLWLRGQVRLGMQLAALKKQLGVRAGQPKKNSPESGKYLPWDKLVKDQTGYSRQSCDEFIRLYEATVAKLKKAKKLELPAIVKQSALCIFENNSSLQLTDEQWALVDDVIGTLTTGETQASLMQELKLVPTPAKMPKKGKGEEDNDSNNDDEAGQMAFHFFEAFVSPLINARTNPDWRKNLFALPLLSDSKHPMSLATVEAEARALLADIEDAKQAAAKPAKGKVISHN